jgi:D-alanine-D-alanine ligase
MIKKKLKLGILYGGKSAEHDVSLVSANNVLKVLDKNKYQIFPIKIGRDGKFNLNSVQKMDVVFPVLHGPYGEDGSMQGLLKILNVPFVGPSVLGSALGMDKDVMKKLLKEAGVPIGKFVTIRDEEEVSFKEIKKKLGLPMFIKPANMGSSVGVSKVKNEKEWVKALANAFKYDTKVVVEEMIYGREIECSVLGNTDPIASVPGEIIANQDFYSYDAKYIDKGSVSVIPAKLNDKTIEKVKELAVKTFKVLNCEGMGRVDFFVKKSGIVLVNEINTIPGFTDISMYPKLWEASGLVLKDLLDQLIFLAIERFEREAMLKTTAK